MMRRVLIISLLPVFGLIAPAFADEEASGLLNTGLDLMRQEQYDRAAEAFQSILEIDAEPLQADAWFWLSRIYLATGRLADAERALEAFLTDYPGHPAVEEAQYQKGRLLCLQGEYESSIQILQGFLEAHPLSDFAPNAWFWVGEALFSLGHLDEADRVYAKLLRDYPRSVKVEAARYKQSLIGFQRRENELLKLLKWSHEETLRTIEEYQRREKTYEQALSVYQRRLNEMKSNGPEAGGGPQDVGDPADAAGTAEPGAPPAPGAGLETELAEKLRLVSLKEEALRLKEQLLDRLAVSSGAP